METRERRRFLKRALAGGAGLALLRGLPARGATTAARVEVLLDEPVGRIRPELLGHFAEHIGGVVYDGIWVGEDSRIPNVGGIRRDLVEHMRRLGPSVVRWPGGCFADSYSWMDGVGPRERRPRRPNFWLDSPFLRKAPDGPAQYEPNHFGTDEFVRFCRLVDAEPYIAANVRSGTPGEFARWVEYCNAPAGATTLADQRAANGSREPYRVRYWGVGNESWGCGGTFTPEEYAMEYSRFASWVPGFGVDLALVAAGPDGGGDAEGSIDWTRGFFSQMALNRHRRHLLEGMYGWALHYYCGTAGEGQAVDFGTADWYALLTKADRMEALIESHWGAMGEFDTAHRVRLLVDEWGAWHRPGSEVHETHLFGQTSTMRDALVAALTLDTFNRHADKVVMGNVAQLVNNLHSLFLAHEERFVATPNFHVFEMYAAHRGGTSLRTVFDCPPVAFDAPQGPGRLWGLGGSASLHDRRLVVTAVNPGVAEAREAEIVVRGARIASARASVLVGDRIQAHNSFEHPDAVAARSEAVRPSGSRLVYAFPPASVVRLTCELD